MVDKELLQILACPICKNSVSEENDALVCRACRKAYPVREGIPVMLIEEAKDIKQGV